MADPQDPTTAAANTLAQGKNWIATKAVIARQDPNEFCEFVLRDEETGRPIDQAPIHERWHRLANKYPRLVIWSHTESGKSSQITLGRVLWELGRNPNIRIAIISNTREQASKNLHAIAQYIERSVELKMVFPHLEPGDIWRSSAIQVKRSSVSKDPSVQAFGVHGSIVGARVDLLILDDILDYENTQTPRSRKDLHHWYQSSVSSRLTQHSRVLCVGTPWHPEDIMHELAKNKLWAHAKFPIIRNGKSTWPGRWPMDRIRACRIERGPLEFARTMMCEARDEADARFKREWIDKALAAGDGWPVLAALNEEVTEQELAAYDAELRLGGPIRIYSGVDLAVQRHAAADCSAISTIMVMPNGDRRLCCVDAGRWSGPEIVERIIDTHKRFNSVMIVENNAAQDFILQFTRSVAAIPIIPFTTGRNKLHPEFGVESLAAEFASDKWIIPNMNGTTDDEISELVTEMLYYQPDAHTGDRLMSLWLAREGARLGAANTGVGVRVFSKGRRKGRGSSLGQSLH